MVFRRVAAAAALSDVLDADERAAAAALNLTNNFSFCYCSCGLCILASAFFVSRQKHRCGSPTPYRLLQHLHDLYRNYPVCIIYLMYLLYCCIITRVRFAVRPFNTFIFAFIWRVLHTAAVRRQRGFSDTENEVVDDVAKVQLHSSRHTVQYYNIL